LEKTSTSSDLVYPLTKSSEYEKTNGVMIAYDGPASLDLKYKPSNSSVKKCSYINEEDGRSLILNYYFVPSKNSSVSVDYFETKENENPVTYEEVIIYDLGVDFQSYEKYVDFTCPQQVFARYDSWQNYGYLDVADKEETLVGIGANNNVMNYIVKRENYCYNCNNSYVWDSINTNKGCKIDITVNSEEDCIAKSGELNLGDELYGCNVIPDDIKKWILDALNLVKYLALALVIVLGVLDFIKAAASGEADAMKKSGNSFLKRIIAVVILFLVPVIVELVLNLVEIYGASSTCLPE